MPTVATQYPLVFVDGTYLSLADARVSVHANSLSYGTGTFEGIRAFVTKDGGLNLLAAREHYTRLHRSAAILGLELRYTVDDLVDASAQLLRMNAVREDVYLRPVLALSSESLQVRMHGLDSRLSIALTPMGLNYINPEGVRCIVSSWRRAPDQTLPNRAKVIGGYVGPALAKTEALNCGADEAIMLNVAGHVAEASTSNIFIRSRDIWFTPPAYDDILEGITRAELFVLINDLLSERVVERSIDRSELYTADEVLLCGTAALVVPVIEIDGRSIGNGSPGERTATLQKALLAIGRGDDLRYAPWVTSVSLARQ
ncbi:MAG: branched-chain amino acid transaminase [Candidatus Aquilonibacter sp.]